MPLDVSPKVPLCVDPHSFLQKCSSGVYADKEEQFPLAFTSVCSVQTQIFTQVGFQLQTFSAWHLWNSGGSLKETLWSYWWFLQHFISCHFTPSRLITNILTQKLTQNITAYPYAKYTVEVWTQKLTLYILLFQSFLEVHCCILVLLRISHMHYILDLYSTKIISSIEEFKVFKIMRNTFG